MIGKALVVLAIGSAVWVGVSHAHQWIDSAHGAAVNTDLGNAKVAIGGYVDQYGVPAGRFVTATHAVALPDGTDVSVSPGDTLTAFGTWSGSYCVVVRAATGQSTYYDSALDRTSTTVLPGGACAAVAATGEM